MCCGVFYFSISWQRICGAHIRVLTDVHYTYVRVAFTACSSCNTLKLTATHYVRVAHISKNNNCDKFESVSPPERGKSRQKRIAARCYQKNRFFKRMKAPIFKHCPKKYKGAVPFSNIVERNIKVLCLSLVTRSFIELRLGNFHPQQCAVYPHKKILYPPKSPISPQKSLMYPPTPKKILSILHWTNLASVFARSAQEPYLSSKEPYLSSKEPHVSTKEPYLCCMNPILHLCSIRISVQCIHKTVLSIHKRVPSLFKKAPCIHTPKNPYLYHFEPCWPQPNFNPQKCAQHSIYPQRALKGPIHPPTDIISLADG